MPKRVDINRSSSSDVELKGYLAPIYSAIEDDAHKLKERSSADRQLDIDRLKSSIKELLHIYFRALIAKDKPNVPRNMFFRLRVSADTLLAVGFNQSFKALDALLNKVQKVDASSLVDNGQSLFDKFLAEWEQASDSRPDQLGTVNTSSLRLWTETYLREYYEAKKEKADFRLTITEIKILAHMQVLELTSSLATARELQAAKDKIDALFVQK